MGQLEVIDFETCPMFVVIWIFISHKFLKDQIMFSLDNNQETEKETF